MSDRDAGAIWRFQGSFPGAVGARVLAIVLGVYVLYLLAANVLLTTRLLRDFVSAGPNHELDYGSAFSLWPGRVRVSDFELQAQDRNVQLEVRMARAVLDVSLHELCLRRFSALRVDAQGTSFRFRHKLRDWGEAEQRRAAAYPPIEGFVDPPLADEERPPDEERKDLWEIRVEGLRAELTEVWMQEYRYVGPAVALGGFWIAPGQSFSVLPAHVGMHGGALSVAGRPLVEHVELSVDANVKYTDLSVTRGADIWRNASAELEVDLSRLQLEALEFHVPRGSSLSLAGGGWLRLRTSFRDGALDPGGTAAVRLRDVRAATPAWAARAELDSDLAVAADGSLRWHTRASRLELDASSRTSAAALHGATLDVSSRPVRIGELGLERVSAAVPELEVPWLGAWAFIAGDLDSLELGGRLEGELRGAWQRGGSLDAEAELRLIGGELTLSDVQARAAGVLGVRVASEAGAPGSSSGGLDIDFDRVELLRAGDRSAPFRASLRSRDLRLESGVEPRLEATLHAVVQPAEPMLQLVSGAELPKQLLSLLFALSRLDATLKLELDERGLSLELEQAWSGSLSGRGYFRRTSGGPAQGAFMVASGLGNVGVSIDGSRTDTEIWVGDDWLAKAGARVRRQE